MTTGAIPDMQITTRSNGAIYSIGCSFDERPREKRQEMISPEIDAEPERPAKGVVVDGGALFVYQGAEKPRE